MINWKVCLLFFRLCIIWRRFSPLTSDKFSFAVRPVTPNICVKRVTSSLWCLEASSCTLWRNVEKFGILPHTLFMFCFVLMINTIWLSRNNQQDAACNRIYCSKVYWRLNMFLAAHRSSPGALTLRRLMLCVYIYIYIYIYIWSTHSWCF